MVQSPGCFGSLYSSRVLLNFSWPHENRVWPWMESCCDCTVFLKLCRVYDLNHLLRRRIAWLLRQPDTMDLLLLSILSFNAYINNTWTGHTRWCLGPPTWCPQRPQCLSPSHLVLASSFHPPVLIIRAWHPLAWVYLHCDKMPHATKDHSWGEASLRNKHFATLMEKCKLSHKLANCNRYYSKGYNQSAKYVWSTFEIATTKGFGGGKATVVIPPTWKIHPLGHWTYWFS